MNVYGSTTLHELLGDFVVYRNLAPVDSRLPRLEDVRKSVDIPAGKIPRKGQPAYARIVVRMLRAAAKLIDPNYTIQQLIYIGDTRMNDGNAFTTIANAGDCRAVLCEGGNVVELSKDHNPTDENPAEIARILQAGGDIWRNR